MATLRWKSTGSTNWAATGNWDTGSVPVGGDTVIFEHNNIDVLSGLDQSSLGSALAALIIDASYTGKIGTAPDHNTPGEPLIIRASALTIGRYGGTGNLPPGSDRLNITLHTDNCAVQIDCTSKSSADPDLPPVRLSTANSAALTIIARKGRFGCGVNKIAEVCTVTALTAGQINQPQNLTDYSLGTGCVLTTLTHLGGNGVFQCAATTVNSVSGSLRSEGSGAITTWNAIAGTSTPNSVGTITTLNQDQMATVDLMKSNAIRAVTTANIKNKALYKDNPVVTGTRTPAVGAEIGSGFGGGGGVGDYG